MFLFVELLVVKLQVPLEQFVYCLKSKTRNFYNIYSLLVSNTGAKKEP